MAQQPYPIQIRWSNTTDIVSKFSTRELEPLHGTPPEKREITDHELDTLAQVVLARSKEYVVVEDEAELEIVIDGLERFRDGIAHPSYGGTWATRQKANSVDRVLTALKTVQRE
jgi:chromosome segregation ATPase